MTQSHLQSEAFSIESTRWHSPTIPGLPGLAGKPVGVSGIGENLGRSCQRYGIGLCELFLEH